MRVLNILRALKCLNVERCSRVILSRSKVTEDVTLLLNSLRALERISESLKFPDYFGPYDLKDKDVA